MDRISDNQAIHSEKNEFLEGETSNLSPGIKMNPETALKITGNGFPTDEEQEGDSNSGSLVSVTSKTVTPTKGYGLKRWRRVKRDIVKDETGSSDPNRMLKRGLSNPESTNPLDVQIDHKHNAEISSPPTTSPVVSIMASNSDSNSSRFATGTTFSDSWMVELPTIAFVKGKFDSENSVELDQRSQVGTGKRGISKKSRAVRERIEKANSGSSEASEVRSSMSVAMPTVDFSGYSNGNHEDRGFYSGPEDSDEIEVLKPLSSEEIQMLCKDNGLETENSLRENAADDVHGDNKEGNKVGRNSEDPFVESLLLLDVAKEKLQKEIKLFGDMATEAGLQSSVFDKINQSFHISDPGAPHGLEEIEESTSIFETELIQRVHLLEHKLEEVSLTIDIKERKILELENILRSSQSLQNTEDANIECQLEDIMKQKMEAEVEYMMLSRTNQSWKVEFENQIALFEEQKVLAEEQAQMVAKLKEAENKACILMKQAVELEASCKKLLETEEVLKLQNNVCKFTLCFFFQLIFFFLAFVLFFLQLFPTTPGIVPT